MFIYFQHKLSQLSESYCKRNTDHLTQLCADDLQENVVTNATNVIRLWRGKGTLLYCLQLIYFKYFTGICYCPVKSFSGH